MNNSELDSKVSSITFAPEHIDNMISKYEEEQVKIREKLQQLLTPLNESKEMFETAQKDYNIVNSALIENNSILSNLAELRNNPTGKKVIRILRTTSHLDQASPVKTTNFPWLKTAIDILSQSKMFLPFDNLWSQVYDVYKSKESFYTGDNKLSVLKNKMKNSITKNTESESPSIIMYKEHYGLYDWFQKGKKIPKVQYMKPFMYETKS